MVSGGDISKALMEKEIAPLTARIVDMTIKTTDAYSSATELLVDLKASRKRIDAAFDPSIKAAFDSHKTAVALKKQFTEKLDWAERQIKSAMITFQMEQRRIAAAKEEELRAKLRKESEDEQIEAAAEMEREGDKAGAEELLDRPVVTPAVIVAPDIPQADGVTMKKVWKFRIENAGILPREYMMPDEKKIGQVVRAMKGETLIAGVVAYAEDSVAVRS